MSAFSEAVKALPNLSLYWTLDSITKAEDQSGNGRNGTGAGGITIGGQAGSATTGHSSCTAFDGVDDLITSTYAPGVNGANRTVGAWVWQNNLARMQDLFICGTESVTYWPRLNASTTGTGPAVEKNVYWSPDWAATDLTWPAAWPGAGQWVFMVIPAQKKEGSTIRLYINGTIVSALPNAGPYTEGKPLQISNAGETNFDGRVQHLFVTEGILSAGQISALFAAASVPEPGAGGGPQYPLSQRNPVATF